MISLSWHVSYNRSHVRRNKYKSQVLHRTFSFHVQRRNCLCSTFGQCNSPRSTHQRARNIRSAAMEYQAEVSPGSLCEGGGGGGTSAWNRRRIHRAGQGRLTPPARLGMVQLGGGQCDVSLLRLNIGGGLGLSSRPARRDKHTNTHTPRSVTRHPKTQVTKIALMKKRYVPWVDPTIRMATLAHPSCTASLHGKRSLDAQEQEVQHQG